MGKNIFLFAQNGGLFFVIFMLFLIAFAIKIAVGLVYDNAIEKSILFTDKSFVENIIYKYYAEFSEEKKCKNTKAYVDNELHNWRICGIHVERFNDIGNIVFGGAVFLCVAFDMVLLLDKNIYEEAFYTYLKYIFFYTLISIIMYIIIKGVEIFTNLNNKRSVLRDKIVNYLDNNLGANEYTGIKANIYIGKEMVDTGYINESELINNENISAQSNVEENGEIDSNNAENNNIKINNTEINTIEIKESLQKNDKEKVIEQVLEEFLI